MLKQLGRVARQSRLSAQRTQIHVATAAGVSHAVISRLETGERWPEDPDRVIAGYVAECDISERELWLRAAEELGD